MTSAADAPPPRRPSLIADPLRTTLVLLAIIGVLAALRSFLSAPPPQQPVPTVDYVPAVDAARQAAPFEVLAPPTLPVGWRATSVRYVPGDDATWHLGILTDDDKYIGVEQSDGDVESLVEEHAAESEPAGTVQVDGQTWQLLRGGDETTLVRADGDAATLVTGDAPQGDVEQLTASLVGG